MIENEQRSELAHFLRTRRSQLSPPEVGLPLTARRKTMGLRREEVAQLADVGVTWYTWLEQGRDINVSTQVLESLARALRLTPAEKKHLFLLARQATPSYMVLEQEHITPFLTRFLEQMGSNPAYIMGRRWDVLAWNHAASQVFTDFADIPIEERNIVHLSFTSKEFRRRFVDWEGVAQRVLAQFRASSSQYRDDAQFGALITELQQHSPEFASWWSRHEVQGRTDGWKELLHPQVGSLVLDHSTFQSEDSPGLKMVVYLPACEETAKKLQLISRESV